MLHPEVSRSKGSRSESGAGPPLCSGTAAHWNSATAYTEKVCGKAQNRRSHTVPSDGMDDPRARRPICFLQREEEFNSPAASGHHPALEEWGRIAMP